MLRYVDGLPKCIAMPFDKAGEAYLASMTSVRITHESSVCSCKSLFDLAAVISFILH